MVATKMRDYITSSLLVGKRWSEREKNLNLKEGKGGNREELEKERNSKIS
jgi:hypothetical protein